MSENEIELKYHPKKGITNIKDLEKLRVHPKFRKIIRGNLKKYLDNGYRKRNTKRVCLWGTLLILILIAMSSVLIYFVSFRGISLAVFTLVVTITIIVSFLIYRSNQIKYLKKLEKNIKKKTRECCEIYVYVDNKPFREKIGCCGITLNEHSFIYVSCDPEKMEVERERMQQEEERRQINQVLTPGGQQVLVDYMNQNNQGFKKMTTIVQSEGKNHVITIERTQQNIQGPNFVHGNQRIPNHPGIGYGQGNNFYAAQGNNLQRIQNQQFPQNQNILNNMPFNQNSGNNFQHNVTPGNNQAFQEKNKIYENNTVEKQGLVFNKEPIKVVKDDIPFQNIKKTGNIENEYQVSNAKVEDFEEKPQKYNGI